MPFACSRIIAWLKRNSRPSSAAATIAAGASNQIASAPSGKKAPAIQASRAIQERCGWRST